jgi:hypothetical protein
MILGYRSRGPAVVYRHYQILRSIGSGLSLESTIEELLEKERSSCGLEIRDYGRRHPQR